MAISRSDMERQLRNMGGIMSLQEPRQGYFLGKLVKKAKRAVKKVVKSPLGKAAILGGLTFGIPGTSFGGLMGKGALGGLKAKLFGGALPPSMGFSSKGILGKLGLTKGGGSLGLTGLGKIAGITGLSGLAGLMAARGQEEEDDDESIFDRGEGLDIDRIVRLARQNDPQFRFLPPAEFTGAYAEGGEVMNPMTMLGLSLLDKGSEMGMEEMEKQKKLMELLQKLKMTDPDKELRKRGELEELRRIEAEKRINKAEGGSPVDDDDLEKVVRDFNKQAEMTGNPLMTLKELKKILGKDIKKARKYKVGKAEGGIMNLGGMEMDLRGGGFVPLGAKEKADDVPARLSKNEFVMTADAVRAAGGGSVDKGADKMYKMMKNLEAQV
jgi:hypothetical protein